MKVCVAKTDKSSIDEPPKVELKDLPPYLEYAFLEGDNKLPVIIAKDLSIEEKAALIKVLKSHKRAIAWKLSDIKGINPEFCTHKILMEEDYKPAVQHQRRVNPKIHNVIKKEVEKLLNAGLIYPILDSHWVSPVHCVPKKGGFTVLENDENELILTRLVMGWRVCIDYRKLNEATHKDHFPLPFMDQMHERLARNEYYCFLDGFSGYFQIHIDPNDQEKTTFTCPYETFAYRRMPFGLCNAPSTFQRCMEKSHFMVKEGIVLGHKISKKGIEVDKAKIDVITKLPHPTTVKGVRSFLGHASFYRRFIKDFSKNSRPMTHLLKKNTPFIFFDDCIQAFQTLKKKLTEAPILIALDWDLPFELMCDASDFAIGAVSGQRHEKHFRPIHYTGKTMNEAESHYTTTKKEMLVVVYAFEKFRSYLILHKSVVYTDHSALKYLFAKKDSKASIFQGKIAPVGFTPSRVRYHVICHKMSSRFTTHARLARSSLSTARVALSPYEIVRLDRRSTETSDGLAAIQAQLNNLGREIKKVNEKVYVAQVGCEQCKGSHYTKDCPQKEEGKTLEEAYYTQFGGPFQGGGYRATLRHFIKGTTQILRTKNEEIRASMDAAIRNQRALLQPFEYRSAMRRTPVMRFRSYRPSSTKTNLRDQVKSISTTMEAESHSICLPFVSRLDNYYREEEGNYGPKFAEAYGASHINDTIPRKEKDTGSFTLPCYNNNVCFDNALVDLGANVSVMPLLTYLNLGLGELAHTRLTVELVDRTVKYPKGIAENVLVGIGKFTFLVDFIILDMPEDIKVPLILERPFLSTARAKIDVYKRKITLRVGEERIVFSSVKPASSLIKRVYMLSFRERMELDLEARLMGETLVLNRSLDPFLEDYIELNGLVETFEQRRNQKR
ncbi:reverse transcriptase domain-containing protein [Tanacetum coccineum]